MAVYYVETGHGCQLREATNIRQAKREALREAGTDAGVQLARKATAADVAWVRGMGGYEPPRIKPAEKAAE